MFLNVSSEKLLTENVYGSDKEILNNGSAPFVDVIQFSLIILKYTVYLYVFVAWWLFRKKHDILSSE